MRLNASSILNWRSGFGIWDAFEGFGTRVSFQRVTGLIVLGDGDKGRRGLVAEGEAIWERSM